MKRTMHKDIYYSYSCINSQVDIALNKFRKSSLKLVLIMGFLLNLFVNSTYAANHQNILLTLDEVKSLVDSSSITLVDARPYIDYKNTHIKGAVSLPTDETFAKSGRSDLVATVMEMRDLMRKAGLEETSKVIIYGGRNVLNISRLFWVLETYGIKDVSIMNDSLTNWKKRGYSTESGEQNIKPSVIYPTLREDKLATMLMVFTAMDTEEESLIDARAAVEYKGERSNTGVYGHIPTSISIPWESNFTADFSKFRPIDELKDIYKNINQKKMNTVYCNKGKESAANYVALRLLGKPVRAYDGSWHEWSLQETLPIEKGH
jgi:thiosulfate/3-mercaptopyruvate sulfurtransferase